MPFPRAAGIILHPTSLPGGHGIGDLGQAAYRFVDFLHESGLTLWQVLPLGPTGASNSPYQSLSSFAGNPLLISLDLLVADGLLKPEDLQGAYFAEGRADYRRAAEFKEAALRKAFAAFQAGRANPALRSRWLVFKREQASWLEDFACFVAFRRHFQNRAWFDWPDAALAQRSPAVLAKAKKELADEIAFHAFCQFCFFSQWRAVKD
ncbi:MAG: 4-alpha-glucanotransferase, partial [Planctomycetota bacterium]|nr:4-alpha-glucanotransferase [Planctomycetota bacterium]